MDITIITRRRRAEEEEQDNFARRAEILFRAANPANVDTVEKRQKLLVELDQSLNANTREDQAHAQAIAEIGMIR